MPKTMCISSVFVIILTQFNLILLPLHFIFVIIKPGENYGN